MSEAMEGDRRPQPARLVVTGADLERVELWQRGLVDRLRLTQLGIRKLDGASETVLHDVEGAPLLAGRTRGDELLGRPLRPVAATGAAPAGIDLAVVVVGPLDGADLHLVGEAVRDGARPTWLVCADRTPAGRALVCEARHAGRRWADDTGAVLRVPWPRTGPGDLLWVESPAPERVAASFGAERHLVVGDPLLRRLGRGGAVIFLTGLSGAGKSTIAKALRDQLEDEDDRPVTLLDGDEVRRRLSPELGFDEAARAANVQRVSWVASLLAGAGGIAITALIAPFAAQREEAMAMAAEAEADFLEVWLSTPLAACEERDHKGLYARARAGEVSNFTGISSPYEKPARPAVTIDTTLVTPEEGARLIVEKLRERQL